MSFADEATSRDTRRSRNARSAREARELTFEDEPAIEEALFNWQDNQSGFSDCLIMAHNRQLGCRSTATVDTRAARLPGASKA